MSVFATTHSGASAAIDEVVANAAVRQRFPAFVIGQSAELFVYANDKPHLKGELQNLLKLGSPDPAVIYRGLLIQLNGIFEGFVKSLITEHIAEIAAQVQHFHELESNIQTSYTIHASRALSRIGEGSINGVSYNFTELQKNMGSCFVGTSPFIVNGEVFTLLMGNCTPERLERLFHQVGLSSPFGDELGKHKSVQNWSGERKVGRVAAMAREELDRQISVRNDIVHGIASKDVVLNDIENAATFFGCLVDAYTDQITAFHT